MSSEMYERMRGNPAFQELVRKRSRFAMVMSIVVLGLFYGFVLLVAFKPLLLGQPVREGSTLTIGVAFEFFMFVFFWVLTAIYVKKANGEYDALTQKIIQDAQKEGK